MATADLSDRTFVVTGANTGIGKETARDLARRGARVILACRSQAKTRAAIDELAADTGSTKLESVSLDLSDLAAVRTCAEQLLADERPIHVLINNAGLAAVRGQTKDGFELAFGTNHLGPYLFTRLLLPRLQASGPARIVNVASAAHYRARSIDWDAQRSRSRSFTGLREYQVSKLCNVLFAKELARRLPAEQVTTYSLHPGVIASDIWQRRATRVLAFIPKLFMKSVVEGARTSLYCATSPEVADQTGRYYTDERERRPSRAADDPELAAELWRRSAEWTGLPD